MNLFFPSVPFDDPEYNKKRSVKLQLQKLVRKSFENVPFYYFFDFIHRNTFDETIMLQMLSYGTAFPQCIRLWTVTKIMECFISLTLNVKIIHKYLRQIVLGRIKSIKIFNRKTAKARKNPLSNSCLLVYRFSLTHFRPQEKLSIQLFSSTHCQVNRSKSRFQ